jgi:hypothetical protein
MLRENESIYIKYSVSSFGSHVKPLQFMKPERMPTTGKVPISTKMYLVSGKSRHILA